MPIFEAVTMGFVANQNLTITAYVPGYVSQIVTYKMLAGEENVVTIEMNSALTNSPEFLNILPNVSVASGAEKIIYGRTSYDLSEYSLTLSIAELKPKVSILQPATQYFKPGDTLPIKIGASANNSLETIQFKTYNETSAEYEVRQTDSLNVNEQSPTIDNKELDASGVLLGMTDGKKTIYIDALTAGGVGSNIAEMPSFEVIYDSLPPKLIPGKEKPFYIEKNGITYSEDALATLRIQQGEVVDLYSNIQEDTSVTSDVSDMASIIYYVDGVEVCNNSGANVNDACEWDTTNLHSEVTVVATDGAGNTYTGDPYTISVDTSSGSRRFSDVTAPGPVTDVLVQNPAVSDGTKLDLTWTNPEDVDLAGIKIYRSQSVYSNETNQELITDINNATVNTYRDVELVAGEAYYYIFRPYDLSGNVLFSTTQYIGTPSIVLAELSEDSDGLNSDGTVFEPVAITLDLSKPTGAATASLNILAEVEDPIAQAINTSKPSNIGDVFGSTERIFKYFEISSNLNEDILDEIMIEFSVAKDWIIENKIDLKNISFYHYVYHSPGVWEEIEATQTGEDDTYYYYQGWTSQLNGLYAIAGRPGYVPATEFLTGSITGMVFIDINADGKIDTDENGASDLIVELYADDGDENLNINKDVLVFAQQTGADGKYNFNELPAGNYIVFISRDGLPDNYELTTENDVLWLTLYENENITDIDFGYRPIAFEEIEKLAEIKEAREQASDQTIFVTKKIRRNINSELQAEETPEESVEKVNIAPAVVWAIVIILVLIFLVWQLTKDTRECHLK
jgi:hypothetical protein